MQMYILKYWHGYTVQLNLNLLVYVGTYVHALSCTFKYVVHYLPQNLVYTLACNFGMHTCASEHMWHTRDALCGDICYKHMLCLLHYMYGVFIQWHYIFFCQDDHYVRLQSSRLFTESTIVFSLQFSYTDLSACMWTSESELKSWRVLEQITSIIP